MSDKPGFTEGPWEVTGGSDVIIGGDYVHAYSDENAHLIAASPDLYAALEVVATVAERGFLPAGAIAKAEAALAKARGEQ